MTHIGEIITLQVGNYANFVGAHLFNLQDPALHPENETGFSHRALWKEGRNFQRERILTPRVLMFDLKRNWRNKFIQHSSGGSAKPASSTQNGEDLTWDGKVQKIVQGDESSDSDETTRVMPQVRETIRRRRSKKKVKLGQHEFGDWSSFAKWRVHNPDKCTFRIPNLMYNSEADELISYGQGVDIYKRLEESAVEGLRLYAEDCDYLEGFHLLVDEYDGFTGIAGGILEHLSDEYDKKACFGIGLNQPLLEDNNKSLAATKRDFRIRIVNTVQLWTAFARHARVFTSLGVCEDIFVQHPKPRAIPGILQDCMQPTVSSAIVAAALDSLTAPYRLHKPTFPLHDMTSLLNAFGHKMTQIGSTAPYPMNQRTVFKALNEDGFSCLTSLTPNVNINLDESIGNLFVMRGFDPEKVMSRLESREYKHAHINTLSACSELYCSESYPKSVNLIREIPSPLKVGYTYPIIHDPSYLDRHCRGKNVNFTQGETWLLPALASAHNSPAVGTILEKIVSLTGGGVGGSSMKLREFFEPSTETCNTANIELEDYAECVDDLCSLRDTYSKD